MDYLELLGRTEEEVLEHLRDKNSPYRISYTMDPRSSGDDRMEKRVIRIKEMDANLQVLVGYFQKPYCT